MKKVIINADDFGLSPEVNLAICECFQKKYISNTTIIINAPYVEEAVELSKKYGFFDKVGLHLNLTEGESLTSDIRKEPLFYNQNGDGFNALFDNRTISRIFISNRNKKVVRKEIESQINKYLEYGFTLKHIDSHHHVHTDLSIYSVLKSLIKKYKFKSIRLTRNLNIDSISKLKRLYKKHLNNKFHRVVNNTTNYFGDFDDFINTSTNYVKKDEVIELMCHPMMDNDRSVNLGVFNESCTDFKKIFNFLNDYTIISYNDL